MEVIFTNDDNVKIKIIDHNNLKFFKVRDSHEVLFRRINTYLIKNNFINGNIIDLGAWIGDNSIPWAMNLKERMIYSIDPSSSNIDFIEKMKIANNISNIKTIQTAISDKNEIISTDDNINHCTFSKESTGKNKISSVSLDYLYENKVIDNISMIHLDVEGFEFNVVKGANKLINNFHPIITFEQHLHSDDYKGLSIHLYKMGYNIYLINERLPVCRSDCRNLIAFPKNLKIDLNKVQDNIGKRVLLSVLKWKNEPFKSKYTATLYGQFTTKEYKNIKSIDFVGRHIFCITDNNFTKIVVLDNLRRWVSSRYLIGEINTNCVQSIVDAFISAQYNVDESLLNIKDICLN